MRRKIAYIMERKTFSVMFFFRRTNLRKNQEAPVFLRITVNGVRADISIQLTVPPDQWNPARGRARQTTQLGKDLNEYLDQIRQRVYQCRHDMKFRNKTITAGSIKDEYLYDRVKEIHTLLEI